MEPTWNLPEPAGTTRNRHDRPEPSRNNPEPHGTYLESPEPCQKTKIIKKNQIKVIKKQNKNNKNQINKIIKIISFHIKKNRTARD